MAHFALVDENNLVAQVITGRNEDETVEGISDWEAHYSGVTGLRAVRTSYNTRGGVHYNPETGEPSEDQTKALRFNYAGIGYTFDPDKGTDGAFIPPKPFESWVLDEDTCLWVAPIPYPEDSEGIYNWNEETQSWIEMV